MPAEIIDGLALSRDLRAALSVRVATLTARSRAPGLAVILVGEDPASQVYVRNKVKACAEVGIHSELHAMPASADEASVLARIQALNADERIDGILVQLPLPPQVSPDRVLEAIASDKDVDGFHVHSMGSLLVGRPAFLPCTPAGCMVMLERYGIETDGREAVVIGRSNIVGKPAALMLLQRNATVTICTSRTRDLSAHTRRADILLVAAGKPGLVHGAMIKPGAAVIDVGIHRRHDGKLTGDVDFDSARAVAGWLTPVPGGVGPMTIAMLLSNAVMSAENRTGAK